MRRRDDDARLLDMLIAGRKILRFAEGITKAEFLADERTQHAVLHCLGIIGEAANHVSDGTQERLDTIRWDEIRGLRNRIAHEYFGVNLEIVWDILADDLEALLGILEDVVPPPDDSDDGDPVPA